MVRDYNGIVKALMGEWDKTNQPIKERVSILPFGQYEDGSVGLAWPGMISAQAEGFKRMADTPMPPINDDDAWRQMSQDSFDAAGLAMTGGLGVGALGGFADNAVGSAGGKLNNSARVKMSDYPVEPKARLIEDLYTDPADRGQGLARRAMEDATRKADADGSPLYLSPLAGDGIDPQRLTDFYTSLGFESIGPSYMRRGPKANAPSASSVPIATKAMERRAAPTLRQASEFETVTPDFTPMQLRGLLAVSVPQIAGEMASSGLSQYRLARSMGEPFLEAASQGGSLARDVKREALDSWSEAMASAKRGPTTRFNYDILGDDGGKMGVATGEVAGDTMFFDWLGDRGYGNQNALGVGGLRALREQVRADFPDVKNFQGLRVSGARGGQDGPEALQSVYIPSNAPTGSAIPLAGEAQDEDPALAQYLRLLGITY